jgi:O-antigen ligase
VRGLVTLGAGVGFYLITATFPSSQDGLKRSLKWIYLGGLLMLIWASVQGYLIYSTGGMPHEFQNIHRIFSIYDTPRNRVAGLAYEPSWLGDQLVILYLPLWLSSVMRGYSAFSTKPKRISIELLLLIWGTMILILAESRISLLSVFVVIGILVLQTGWHKTGQWAEKISARRGKKGRTTERARGRLLQVALWVGLILLMILAIFFILWVISFIDWRIERIFQLDYLEIFESSTTPLYTLSERLAYAERVVYWDSGFQVFSRYPLFGVGVGNSGFFFRQYTSAYGYHLPEIIRILTGAPQFPNTKSLWVRLLAETGLVGFVVFVAWLIILAFGAWHLKRHSKGIIGMIGLAGSLTLIAQVIEGFSLDTFALPHLWVALGLITTALSISKMEGSKKLVNERDNG